jgi:hypothetical protein
MSKLAGVGLPRFTAPADNRQGDTLTGTLPRRFVPARNRWPRLAAALFAALLLPCLLSAQPNPHLPQAPKQYGPYNGIFLPDGAGIRKRIEPLDSIVLPDSPWTISCWFQASDPAATTALLAGVGDPAGEDARYLGLQENKLVLWLGHGELLTAPAPLPLGKTGWHFAAAAFDGKLLHLYEDGTEVASNKPTLLGRVSPVIELAPASSSWSEAKHFGGKIAAFSATGVLAPGPQIGELAAHPPDFSWIEYETGTMHWPVQTRGQAGYSQPQDPATLPHSNAPFSKAVAQPVKTGAALEPQGSSLWTIANGWKLIPAPKLSAAGEAISQPGFETKDWWAATVPGTVLTTMIDRGVYPDPDYGLDNLAIPESLNKQDYWYRVEFPTPRTERRQLLLTLNGINYAAEVWLNGKRLGDLKGAFLRGFFDVSGVLAAGRANALAIRISPPPHPGIPNEESIKGGPGENGGIMALDGPTFMATEGWDWIPGIRDRNTGLWQDVTLSATGPLRLGDPQVITKLPLPDTSRAEIRISAPVENLSGKALKATLTASFDDVSVTKSASLAPGDSTIELTPADFAQLTVQHPRLWWPNGYGKPDLHTLKLAISSEGGVSDSSETRFGIREVTYELSLYDATGHLRRVEVSPTAARLRNEKIVDVSHEGMKSLPPHDPKQPYPDWASSIVPGAENSPAFTPVATPTGSTDLVLKVNGVRIAARGGNWGMDDSRKRVSREHLEPYFRLHRDANLNIIRNWMGQNTEQTFYDLADEYGLMVWNDFWDSTQNYNLEAQDPALFLKNAEDTVLRFRNHPSIVIWCGRNEGVPQPIITDGLNDLLTSLDGTRYYSPSSNQVNLRNSGPYQFKEPATYYEINKGFSVELGVPSLPTLESWKAWIPEADQWPVSDSWAYHDWHQSGNGDVEPFMLEVEKEFGAATSLEDFERKAQMLNYTEHRALFEGFNAHLWEPSSGRMLWMTQPAWPSSSWQILSSDYDTQASFYGVKKACEPIHAQLDLTNYQVDVVNTTTAAAPGLTLEAKVYNLANQVVAVNKQQVALPADAVTHSFKLDLAPLLSTGVVLVKLTLSDYSANKVVSENLYWLGANSYAYRQLTKLPTATISAKATSSVSGDITRIHVRLHNESPTAALAAKLTLESAGDGSRILPAYYTDNYTSLLPQEDREIEVEYPSKAAKGPAKFALAGWNINPQTIAIEPVR